MERIEDIVRERMEKQIKEELKGMSVEQSCMYFNGLGDYLLDLLGDVYVDYEGDENDI